MWKRWPLSVRVGLAAVLLLIASFSLVWELELRGGSEPLQPLGVAFFWLSLLGLCATGVLAVVDWLSAHRRR